MIAIVNRKGLFILLGLVLHSLPCQQISSYPTLVYPTLVLIAGSNQALRNVCLTSCYTGSTFERGFDFACKTKVRLDACAQGYTFVASNYPDGKIF
jgi:hypothetical protein